MCGFLALFSPTEPVTDDELLRGLETMRNRGPDSSGTWISEDHRVGLAHSRLAIIDLSTGDQPIVNEDETIAVIVNGELYDLERICTDLEGKGHRFKTGSDSEIVIHLYEEHGAACLEHLRGEFAFVLWDSNNQQLFMARDRVGTKPLYYTRHGGRLLIASEAKAFFALGVPARWDRARVYDSIVFGAMFNLTTEIGTDTLFSGVRQIPPGHYALMGLNEELRPKRYWDFEYMSKSEDEASDLDANECVELIKERFEEAVRQRLRADVEVGCYLSAGIDSAGALAFAASISNRPVTAFTMTFTDDAYDEGAMAAEIAKSLECPYVPIEVDHRQMAEVYEKCVWHSENYLWNTNVMAKYLLSNGVRQAGFKVVLSGQGSDEVFGGYPFFRHALAPASDESLAGLPAHLVASIHGFGRVLGGIPGFLSAATRSAGITRALLDDDFAGEFAGRDANWLRASSLSWTHTMRWKGEAREMYFWNKTALADYLLSCVGDRPEMANSVESRIPYLDHHLIEALGRVPSRLKINAEAEKILLREILRGRLSEVDRRRKKKPFLAPPASLNPDSALYECLRDQLAGCGLPGFLNRSRVEAFVNKLPKIESGRFLSYTRESDRQILEADLCLMLLSSLATMGRCFSISEV